METAYAMKRERMDILILPFYAKARAINCEKYVLMENANSLCVYMIL